MHRSQDRASPTTVTLILLTFLFVDEIRVQVAAQSPVDRLGSNAVDAWKTLPRLDDRNGFQEIRRLDEVAIAELREKIQAAADSQSAEGCALRGTLKWTCEGDKEGAKIDLLKAVELAPLRADMRLHLTRFYLAVGDWNAARTTAATGYRLRLAEQQANSFSNEADEMLIALAFHAERWSDVVELCNRVPKTPYGYEQEPYAHFAILALFAQGKTEEAQTRWDLSKKSGGFGYENFVNDVALAKSKNPNLSDSEVLALIDEQRKPVDTMKNRYALIMLDQLCHRLPDLAIARLQRAELRWKFRRAAMSGAGAHSNALINSSLAADWIRQSKIELKTFSVEEILADLEFAVRNGLKDQRIDSLWDEVQVEGIFVLGWPDSAPWPASDLVDLDEKIERITKGTVLKEKSSLLRDPATAELRDLRQLRAETLRDFGDVLGAVDAYGLLIHDTQCEHDPAIPPPEYETYGKYQGARARPERERSLADRVASWYFERGKLLHLLGSIDDACLDFAMAIHYDDRLREEVQSFQFQDGSKRIDRPVSRHLEQRKMVAAELEARGKFHHLESSHKAWLEALGIDPRCDPEGLAEKLAAKAAQINLKESLTNEPTIRRANSRQGMQNAVFSAINPARRAIAMLDAPHCRRRLAEALIASAGFQPEAVASSSAEGDRSVRIEALVEYDRGIELASTWLDKHPQNDYFQSELHRLLVGRAQWMLDAPLDLRHLSGALSDLNRAIAMVPNQATALFLRGKCRVALGDQQGYSDLTSAVALDNTLKEQTNTFNAWLDAYRLPDQTQALVTRYGATANERFDQNDFAGSFLDSDYACKLSHDHPSLLFQRGRALLRADQVQQALRDLQASCDIHPSAESYRWLGEAEIISGQLDAAVASLGKAIELDPEHNDRAELLSASPKVWAIGLRAFAHCKLKRFHEAKADFARLFQRDKTAPLLPDEWCLECEREMHLAILAAVESGELSNAMISELIHPEVTTTVELAEYIASREMFPSFRLASHQVFAGSTAGKNQDSMDDLRLALWRSLASKGSITAMKRLGDANYFGKRVPRNLAQAQTWYFQAAKTDDTHSLKQIDWLKRVAEIRRRSPRSTMSMATNDLKSLSAGRIASGRDPKSTYDRLPYYAIRRSNLSILLSSSSANQTDVQLKSTSSGNVTQINQSQSNTYVNQGTTSPTQVADASKLASNSTQPPPSDRATQPAVVVDSGKMSVVEATEPQVPSIDPATAQKLREQATQDLERLNQAVKDEPTVARWYEKRAIAKLLLKDDEGALEDANTCIELAPAGDDGYGLRYFALHLLGRDKEATAAKERFLSVSSPDKVAKLESELATLKLIRGD